MVLVYNIFNCVSIWLNSFCGKWEGWDLVNRFNHTSWVAVVTQTYRLKSVRNRCVIEVFVAFLCCHFAFRECFVGVRSCHRTESDIFFFSLYQRFGHCVCFILKQIDGFEYVTQEYCKHDDKFASLRINGMSHYY